MSPNARNLIPELGGLTVEEALESNYKRVSQGKAYYEEWSKLPETTVPLLTKEILLRRPQRSPDFSVISGRETVTIGDNHPHSTRNIQDLKEIRITQLTGRKTHKEYFLPCRIIRRAQCDIAVDFLIEDPDGNFAQVFVFNYPFLANASAEEVKAIFPLGAVIAIKEPTYKVPLPSSQNLTPFIRVDSPSDIVFLDDDPGLSSSLKNTWVWKENVETPLRTAEEWKAVGTQAFKKKQFFHAAVMYSEGLKIDPTNHVIILNRIELYLRMNWFHTALSEARRALEMEDLDIDLRYKAVGRAARACYGLEDFDEAISYTGSYPEDEYLRDLGSRAKKRKIEQTEGEYDWLTLFKRRKEPYRPDIADYRGPVEARESKIAQGQRGLFTTRDVKAGELLVVSKPIASCYVDEMKAFSSIFVLNLLSSKVEPAQRHILMRRTIERLWDDERLGQSLSLHSGGAGKSINPSPLLATSSESNVSAQFMRNPRSPAAPIDVANLEALCTYNPFGFGEEGDHSWVPDNLSVAGSMAVYDLPSFCNHSCLSNASNIFLGDTIVLRALCAIPAGEEVTLGYFDNRDDVSERETMPSENSVWGFTCTCKLCQAIKVDGATVRARRYSILQKLKKGPSEAEVKRLVSMMEDTYRKPHWADVPVRYGLCEAYAAAVECGPVGEQSKSRDQMLFDLYYKAFTASGVTIKVGKKKEETIEFEIAASPSRGVEALIPMLIMMTCWSLSTTPRSGKESSVAKWLSAAASFSNRYFGGEPKLFLQLYGEQLQRMIPKLVIKEWYESQVVTDPSGHHK